MLLDLCNGAVVALLAGLLGLYLARYRGQDPAVYLPAAAWTRAGIYFCCCFLVCWLSGAQAMLLASPLATADQLDDPRWVSVTVGLVLLVSFAYWGVWGRYTLRFDRRLHLATQLPFGLVWGASAGQVILTVWHLFSTVGGDWPAWQIWIATWFVAGSWHWWFHDFYWDLYVAPEHDTPFSIVLKTILLHIPQTALCTLYLTVYGNAWILVGLQTIALLAAAIFMRLPPPWSTEATPPARPHPFILGLVRGGGYLSPDPAHDAYLAAAHSPPRNTIFPVARRAGGS
jgi:hypothetical protein